MDDKFTLIKSDTLGPVKQDTTIEWKSGTGGIWIGPPGNVNRHPQPCIKDGSDGGKQKGKVMMTKLVNCSAFSCIDLPRDVCSAGTTQAWRALTKHIIALFEP